MGRGVCWASYFELVADCGVNYFLVFGIIVLVERRTVTVPGTAGNR